MTIKTALSLPKEQFIRLEKIRKQKGLSRSALIQKLLAAYLKQVEEQNMVKEYVAGYGRSPEDIAESEAMAKAAAEAFQEEDLA